MGARITLVGNVGQAPEQATGNAGTTRAKFSLAVNRRKGSEEVTDWYTVVAWGKGAERVMKGIQKGSKLVVFGRLSANKTADGKMFLDVDMDDFEYAGPKPETTGVTAPSEAGNGPFTSGDDNLPW